MAWKRTLFKKKIIETEVDTDKLTHVLEYLRNANQLTVSLKKLDQMMQNYGSPQFSYGVLNSAYESDPTLQTLIKDFDDKKITLFGPNEVPFDQQSNDFDLDLDSDTGMDTDQEDQEQEIDDLNTNRPPGDEENAPIVKKMAKRAAKL